MSFTNDYQNSPGGGRGCHHGGGHSSSHREEEVSHLGIGCAAALLTLIARTPAPTPARVKKTTAGNEAGSASRVARPLPRRVMASKEAQASPVKTVKGGKAPK